MQGTLYITHLAQKLEGTEINKTLEFRVVSDIYRERIPRKKMRRNHADMDDPIIEAVISGKTILVDAQLSLGVKSQPYKNLYNYLNSRGYRLRMYRYDDVDLDVFNGLLMWAEPFVVVWTCPRCDELGITSDETKPTTKGCESKYRFHFWKRITPKNAKTLKAA